MRDGERMKGRGERVWRAKERGYGARICRKNETTNSRFFKTQDYLETMNKIEPTRSPKASVLAHKFIFDEIFQPHF